MVTILSGKISYEDQVPHKYAVKNVLKFFIKYEAV